MGGVVAGEGWIYLERSMIYTDSAGSQQPFRLYGHTSDSKGKNFTIVPLFVAVIRFPLSPTPLSKSPNFV